MLIAPLSAGSQTPSAGSPASDSSERARVGDQLGQRLKGALATDEVPISVVLRHRDLPVRGALRRSLVRSRQQRVLDALPVGRFRLGRRYRSLSGFSASATPAAIDALTRHPEVEALSEAHL